MNASRPYWSANVMFSFHFGVNWHTFNSCNHSLDRLMVASVMQSEWIWVDVCVSSVLIMFLHFFHWKRKLFVFELLIMLMLQKPNKIYIKRVYFMNGSHMYYFVWTCVRSYTHIQSNYVLVQYKFIYICGSWFPMQVCECIYSVL